VAVVALAVLAAPAAVPALPVLPVLAIVPCDNRRIEVWEQTTGERYGSKEAHQPRRVLGVAWVLMRLSNRSPSMLALL
jgi:hypothetical protein